MRQAQLAHQSVALGTGMTMKGLIKATIQEMTDETDGNNDEHDDEDCLIGDGGTSHEQQGPAEEGQEAG